MTYLNVYTKPMTVLIGDLSFSGSVTSGSYVTINVDIDELASTGGGTATLTLGTGHYLASATLGASTSSGSTGAVDFQWELDGSVIGSKGGRQPLGKVGGDSAECVFSVTSGTSDLKIKVTSVVSTITVLQTYSQVYIRKVSL